MILRRDQYVFFSIGPVTLTGLNSNPTTGEEIPYKTHIPLDNGGMHPNREEYL